MKGSTIKQRSTELEQTVEEVISFGLDPIKHLKQLDYSKRAGTEGEQKASKYIFSTLQKYGYQPQIQEFHFLKSRSWFSLILILLLLGWGLLSLINVYYLENNLIISVLILLVPIIVILVLINLNSVIKYFLHRKAKQMQKLEDKLKNQTLKEKEKARLVMSRNIIADIGPDETENHFLFTAHIDTISSKISLRIMKYFGILGMVCFSTYSGAYFLNVISSSFFQWNFMKDLFLLFLVLLFLTYLSLGILFISRTLRGNESHGVIDDGTGIAILLELAKFLKDQNIQNYKFTFGFFGAEEAGLIGSSYYYCKTQFDKNKLLVISVDMIGEKAPLAFIKVVNPINKMLMDPVFNSRINEVAEILNIRIKGSNFFYPGSDFAHWLFDGYKTNWLINRNNFIHSKQDNFDNVNEIMVNNALRVMIGYIIDNLF